MPRCPHCGYHSTDPETGFPRQAHLVVCADCGAVLGSLEDGSP